MNQVDISMLGTTMRGGFINSGLNIEDQYRPCLFPLYRTSPSGLPSSYHAQDIVAEILLTK